MPHKRNPILSENITGLARLVRAYAMAALENIALWHERDISHSSVERVIAPDATILVDFMLSRLIGILENLVVNKDRMLENLNKTKGLIYSQRILHRLIQKGLARERAYELVQRNALKASQTGEEFEVVVPDAGAAYLVKDFGGKHFNKVRKEYDGDKIAYRDIESLSCDFDIAGKNFRNVSSVEFPQ